MTPSNAPPHPAFPPLPSVGKRYGVAVVLPLAAFALEVALRGILAPNYLFLYLGAVVVSAWFGGFRPGLVASLLSALLGGLFVVTPAVALGEPSGAEVMRLVLFLGVGWLTSTLSARQAESRYRAEEQTVQLQDQAMELEQQAEESRSLNEELERQVEEAAALRRELERANERLRVAAAHSEHERQRLDDILETLAEGVLFVDRDGIVTYANAAALRIQRRPRDEMVGSDVRRPLTIVDADGAPLPPERYPVLRTLDAGAVVAGQELGMDGPWGRTWLRVNSAPLRDAGGVAGAVLSFEDVTAARQAAARAHESEARFRAMADQAPMLVWLAGTDGLCDYVNRPWLAFTGRTMAEERGNGWAEGVHPDDYQRTITAYVSSIEARRDLQTDFRLRRHDGQYRWMLATGVPRFLGDGAFAGYVGSCIDITERREAEDFLRFLAEAGGRLASSLDLDETIRRAAHVAVPALADYCVLDLMDDDGRLRRVEGAHADAEGAAAVRALLRFPPDPRGDEPAVRALRTAAPVVASGAEAALVPLDADPARAEALRRLGTTAAAYLPLQAGGRMLGVLTLGMGGSGRALDPSALVRAEELARRVALAVDNARLYDRAVDASRAKSDFLAVMSHELRTPLNAILGYTDLFMDGIPEALPAPMQPQMRRVQSAARHLLGLIDDILGFARLEWGREEVRASRVSVAALVADAVGMVEPQAMERGIALRAGVVDEGLHLHTDALKARQVLVNLLGNAVKFTDRGEVTVDVTHGGDDVCIAVRDTGIGIAPEQLGRIFEPFWQADQGLQRQHGGSGLGLSVALHLTRLLGGDVHAESVPGEGSTFTVRLPRGPSA